MVKLQASSRHSVRNGSYKEGMSFALLIDIIDAYCVCVCMYVCMYACMHACMHACVYVYVDVDVSVYVYVYVDVDVYVYVCTHRYRTGRMTVGEVML